MTSILLPAPGAGRYGIYPASRGALSHTIIILYTSLSLVVHIQDVMDTSKIKGLRTDGYLQNIGPEGLWVPPKYRT
jgi:hypothetical protein